MSMPATAFPAPAGFPLSPSAQDPRYGANPYVAPGAPVSSAPSIKPMFAAAGAAGFAVEEGNTFDIERQTTLALTKLASVNPELAQQLVEQREGSGSGGIFGFFKDVVGGVIGGGVSLGGKALEIIGRTSHIVPQWFNPNDEGSWYYDIGQALSGEDKTNWNQVFKEVGMEQSWLTATAGFGLDVLTDPITWATFGAGAGVSTAEKAAVAAKTVATKGWALKLAESVGIHVDEADTLLTKAWGLYAGQGRSGGIQAIKRMADGGAEELALLSSITKDARVLQGVQDAFAAGAKTYDMAYSRTLKGFLQKGDSLAVREGVTLEGSAMRDLFEGIARGANFTKYGDESWNAAKAAAGALGGVRARYAVPFTQLRYISPVVPQSWRLGFGWLGRFGAGLNANKVITSEILAGRLPAHAMSMLASNGWEGVQRMAREGDDVARSIVALTKGGRAPWTRSAFWSASERAGRYTQHLSPGAKMNRMGLGYHFYREGIRNAKTLRQRLTNDLFYNLDASGSGAEVRSDLYSRYNRTWGGKSGKVEEQLRDASDFMDFFAGATDIPITDADLASGRFDDWFWSADPQRAAAKSRHDAAVSVPGYGIFGDPDYAKAQELAEQMKATLSRVTGEDRKILEDLGATEAFGLKQVERQGLHVGDATRNWDDTGVVHPDDIPVYQGEVPPHLAGEQYIEVPAGTTVSDARFGGMGPQYVATADEGMEGVRLSLDAAAVPSGRRVRVTTNVKNVMDVDLDTLDTGVAKQALEGGESYADVVATVRAMMDKDGRALGARLHPLMDNPIVKSIWSDDTEAALVSAVLRNRVDAPEAVRFFSGGEARSLVVLDPTRVKVITESAPLMLPRGGYFRRTLSDNVRALVGGEGTAGGRRVFGSPGEMTTRFKRETRNMTLGDAENYVRTKLREEGFEVPDELPIFERDVLKAHENYVSLLGNNLFAHMTGGVTADMLRLGNLVPGTFGGVARQAKVQFEMPMARLEGLVRAGRDSQDAYLKLQDRIAQFESKAANQRVREYDRVALAMAYLERGLTGTDIPAEQLARSLDSVVESSARLGRTVGEETTRLNKRAAALATERETTERVWAALRLEEFDMLDQFIEGQKMEAIAEGQARRAADPRTWDRETANWDKARRGLFEGEPIEDLGSGIWKHEHRTPPMRLGNRVVEGEMVTTYWKVMDDRVVGFRVIDEAGSVVAQTDAAFQRQGIGLDLIIAQWKAAGVTDIASVQRMVAENVLTPASVNLNKRAARRILGVDPEAIKDALSRGQLYIGKDETIYTKDHVLRRAGRKLRVLDDIDGELRELDSLRNELDDLRAGPEQATVRQQQAATAFDRAGVKLAKAEQATLRRSEREAAKQATVVERARARMTEAVGEYNRAMAEVEGAWSEMKPAISFEAEGKAGLRQVQIPGLGGVSAHPFVAEELEYMFRGRTPGWLAAEWRKYVLGPWKRWATYRNPGFHVRNNFGAWFNNKLGGVDTLDETFSFRVNMARGDKGGWYSRPVSSAEWQRLGFGNIAGISHMEGRMTYGQVSEMLADMGIGRANTTATAITMGGEGLTAKGRGAVGSVFQNLDRKLRNVGGLTEDFHRVSAWSAGMRHTGGDVYGARGFVMVRHGDYSDLTEAEDHIRDLIPFYKWMRTNTPYQFRMLAENPGLLTAVTDKSQTFVYEVQGKDRYDSERNLPQWMKQAYRVPVPEGVPVLGGETLMFDLPFSDLYNGLRDYLSSGLPYVRNVVESYGIKQSVYTGAPLGERMVPLSGVWNAPIIRDVLQALPWAQEGPDGKTYIPDQLDNVLAGVPLYARYRNWMLSDPSRVEHRTSAIFSAMLGFSFRAEDATAAEAAFYYEELLPTISRLKSMGYEFPTAEDLETMGTNVLGYGQAPTIATMFPTGVGPTLAPLETAA